MRLRPRSSVPILSLEPPLGRLLGEQFLKEKLVSLVVKMVVVLKPELAVLLMGGNSCRLPSFGHT